jgi:tetratricopeptide (TPR) repeat protein
MSTRKAIQCLGTFLFFVFSFRAISQSAPGYQSQIESHNRQAQVFLSENRPDLAIPEFRAIVALDRNNVDALGNLGVLLFFQNNYAEAVPPLRAALKLRPTLLKTQALLGMAEKRTGDYKNAQAHLAKAFPNLKEQKVKIDTGMELIEMYSGMGELDKAAAIADVLSSLYSTNPDVLYTSYRIHSDLAAEAMLSLSMAAPKSARMYQAMAHELARKGETAGAIRNYREALKIDPQLPGLHFELAEMLNASSSPEEQAEAVAEYKAALAVNRFDEKAECKLGEIARRKGGLNESFEHYSLAAQLQPNDPEAAIGLAGALAQMNQPQKAQSLLEHALQIDPTSALAHFRLGTLYRQAGRTEDAKRELAEFQKYKDMKEKLGEIYHEMRLEPAKQDAADEADSRK